MADLTDLKKLSANKSSEKKDEKVTDNKENEIIQPSLSWDPKISEVFRKGGKGNRGEALYNALHGFNHINPGTTALSPNRDSNGFTFFTKPVLNLSYNNVQNDRRMAHLTDEDPASAGCAIKCMLSPYKVRGLPYNDRNNVRSLLVDDASPFIPLLTNTLVSVGGFNDYSVNVYTTDEGIAKETMSWAEGRPRLNGTYDFTLGFRNLDGDIITSLFEVWWLYAGHMAVGSMRPYAEFISNYTIDYQSRMYRFVMDESNTYIQKAAVANAGWPTAVPTGAAFNFDATQVFNTSNDNISVPFRSSVILYNDPIILSHFNRVSIMFNPALADRKTKMHKLSPSEKLYFNYMAYPFIEDNNELAWWVFNDQYKEAK